MLADPRPDEGAARQIAAALATLLQAAALLRADSPSAMPFIAARLAQSAPSSCYGMLPASLPFARLLERALPTD